MLWCTAPGSLYASVDPHQIITSRPRCGTLDLVVCVEPPSHIDTLTVLRLRTDELAVYAPPSVTQSAPSTWGPWVTFPTGSYTCELIDDALRRIGAPFGVLAESHQPEVLREMVALGFGWTVLPTFQAGRLRRVGSLIKRSLVLARRSAAAPNAAAAAFAAQLRSKGSGVAR